MQFPVRQTAPTVIILPHYQSETENEPRQIKGGWRDLQPQNIESTMKCLLEPIEC
jgi:hypothetical protein